MRGSEVANKKCDGVPSSSITLVSSVRLRDSRCISPDIILEYVITVLAMWSMDGNIDNQARHKAGGSSWNFWTKQKSRFWSYFQGIWHPTDRFQAVTRVEGPLHQNVMTSPDKGSFWCFAIKPGFHFRSNWPRDQNALVGQPSEFSVLDMTADQETRSYTEKLWLANLGTSVPL